MFKNYMPRPNLSFILKLVERIVFIQSVEYFKINNLYGLFQSAHRYIYSAETALPRAQNDLLQAVENGRVTSLSLRDLRAVFDPIDLQKLGNLINQSLGIRGVALK